MSGYPMITAEHVLAIKNVLGEGPLWNSEEQALYWVDIQNHRVYRLYPATGEHECFDVDLPVTALGLRVSGGLVVDIIGNKSIMVAKPRRSYSRRMSPCSRTRMSKIT